MIATERFDSLYADLAAAWDAHQQLRRAGTSLPTLAESSARLYQARLAMWDWHSCHTWRTG